MDRVVPTPLVDGKMWCMLQRDRHNCNSPNLPNSEDCNTNLGVLAIIGKHGKNVPVHYDLSEFKQCHS